MLGATKQTSSVTVGPVPAALLTATPTTVRTYDRWGNVLQNTDAAGNITAYRYDANSQVVKVTEAADNLVDKAQPNNTTLVVSPVRTAYYDIAGQLIESRDAYGQATRFYRNAAGEVIEQRNADNSVSNSWYNIFGELIQATDEMGYRTRTAYDNAGRVTQVASVDAAVEQMLGMAGYVGDFGQMAFLTPDTHAQREARDRFVLKSEAIGRALAELPSDIASLPEDAWAYLKEGAIVTERMLFSDDPRVRADAARRYGEMEAQGDVAAATVLVGGARGVRLDIAPLFDASPSKIARLHYRYGDTRLEVPGTHGLDAIITDKGILQFDIRSDAALAATKGSGRDMFDGLMRRLAADKIEVNGIHGQWIAGYDSVNHAQFVANLKMKMEPELAAASTWTGRAAARHGYTVVTPIRVGSNMVEFLFTKPKPQ